MLSGAVELSFFSPHEQKIRIKNVKIIFFIVSFNITNQRTERCGSTQYTPQLSFRRRSVCRFRNFCREVSPQSHLRITVPLQVPVLRNREPLGYVTVTAIMPNAFSHSLELPLIVSYSQANNLWQHPK